MTAVGSNCPDENRLLAHIDGVVPEHERGQIDAHLLSCRECQRLLFLLGPEDGPLSGPRTLGRYRLGRELGRGGMGVVYAAHDPLLEREVAVKALDPLRAGAQWRRAALGREAGVMAKLSHANVVQVFDVDVHGEHVFVAMELIEGTTLSTHLRAPLPWAQLQPILLAVADGVIAAHDAGIVHGDLKPGNVLLGRDGRVAVGDFGLSTWLSTESASTESEHADDAGTHGALRGAGTPAYMAPEQHDGTAIDARADVFSLCAMAYHLVYGVLPFEADTVEGIAIAKQRGDVVAPRRDDAPRWVRTVLTRGMAATPETRWPDMRSLRVGLAGPRYSATLVAVAAATTVAGLATIAVMARPPDCPAARDVAAAWTGASLTLDPLFADVFARDVTGVRDRVHGAVDDYVQRWSAAWMTACEAAGGEQAMAPDRRACLEPGREALHTLWTSLADADPELLYRLDLAAESLPRFDDCEDHDGAVARSPQEVERLTVLRGQLARSVVQTQLGDYERAIELVEGIAPAAHALSATQLEAAAHQQLAAVAHEQGKQAEAEAAAALAYPLALQADDIETAGAAAQTAARSAAILGRPDDAARWLRYAQAAHERQTNPRMTWRLHRTALVVHQLGGDPKAAEAAGERALAAIRETYGEDAWELAGALNDLANVLFLRRELQGARTRLEHGLACLQAAFGPEHPQAAVLNVTLGNVLMRMGELDIAAEKLRDADRILARTLGPLEGNRLLVQLNLGTVELMRERWTEGRDALLPLLGALRGASGQSSQTYGATLTNIGVAELELGLLDDARRRFDEVLTLRREAGGDQTAEVAEAVTHLGLVDLAQARYDDAQARFEDALRIYDNAGGPELPSLSSPLLGLADVAIARGTPELASAPLARALALREAGGFTPTQVQEVRDRIAELPPPE